MKILTISAVVLTAVGIAAGQQPSTITQDGDKITVPLSNPSQPPTVKLNMIKGSVTVTGSAGQQGVVIESSGDGGSRSRGHGRDVPTPGYPPRQRSRDRGSLTRSAP